MHFYQVFHGAVPGLLWLAQVCKNREQLVELCTISLYKRETWNIIMTPSNLRDFHTVHHISVSTIVMTSICSPLYSSPYWISLSSSLFIFACGNCCLLPQNHCCKETSLVWPCRYCLYQTAPLFAPSVPKHPICLFYLTFSSFWLLSFSHSLTKLSAAGVMWYTLTEIPSLPQTLLNDPR